MTGGLPGHDHDARHQGVPHQTEGYPDPRGVAGSPGELDGQQTESGEDQGNPGYGEVPVRQLPGKGPGDRPHSEPEHRPRQKGGDAVVSPAQPETDERRRAPVTACMRGNRSTVRV